MEKQYILIIHNAECMSTKDNIKINPDSKNGSQDIVFDNLDELKKIAENSISNYQRAYIFKLIEVADPVPAYKLSWEKVEEK